MATQTKPEVMIESKVCDPLNQALTNHTISGDVLDAPFRSGSFTIYYDADGNVTNAQWQGGLLNPSDKGMTQNRGVTERTVSPEGHSP